MRRGGVGVWPPLPEQLAAVAVGAAAVAAAVVVAVVLVRWWLERRALARRGALCQLVPTDSFDPSLEEVLRFAAESLSRAPKAGGASGARRATAVRLRLSANRDGELVYMVEGPRRAARLFQHGGYREVDAVASKEAA